MSVPVSLPVDALAYGADFTRDYWHGWADPATTIEDVKKSTFWAHHLGKLKAGALVDIVTRDGLFDVQVRIISITNGIVRLNVLRHFEDEGARAPILASLAEQRSRDKVLPGVAQARELADQGFVPEGYKVGFNPGNKTFYVQYLANGQKLDENITDRMAALKKARAHARTAGVEVEWNDEIDGPAPARKPKAA